MSNEDILKESLNRIKQMCITTELHPMYDAVRIAEIIRKECEHALSKLVL